MNIEFHWDSRKAASNRSRHAVSFQEALQVFADPLARIFDDLEHSTMESREIIIGHSQLGRLLLVSFTAREGAVRIISARKATRRERTDYEENAGS